MCVHLPLLFSNHDLSVSARLCRPPLTYTSQLDYEQQRLHLLRKHGIDLEDSYGDGTRTKRMDRKDVELLMGGDGKGGIFTWREKNRRKVCACSVAGYSASIWY